MFLDNQSASAGGAITEYGNRLRVLNCTFARNQSESGGGALDHSGDYGLVANSILWNNTDSGGATHGRSLEQAQILAGPGTLTVSNSCVRGLAQFAGHGNLGYDPLFVDHGQPTTAI